MVGEVKLELARARPRFMVTGLFLAFVAVAAQAQNPIDVEKLSAQGDHYQAMVAWERMPKRRATLDATAAMAKSAWGLGLNELAMATYDRMLELGMQAGKLDAVSRARVYLAQGILQYQEENYQAALRYAERMVGGLPQPSPLRGQGWYLWGETLVRLGKLSLAREKFEKALEEAQTLDQGEVHFALAQCSQRLGKYDQAQEHFEAIPLAHSRGGDAMRGLAQVALERGEYAQAIFWLTRGRSDHPDQFLDSWVDYAMVQAAIGQKDVEVVRQTRAAALAKYAPSDAWLILLESAAEAYEQELLQQKEAR